MFKHRHQVFKFTEVEVIECEWSVCPLISCKRELIIAYSALFVNVKKCKQMAEASFLFTSHKACKLWEPQLSPKLKSVCLSSVWGEHSARCWYDSKYPATELSEIVVVI